MKKEISLTKLQDPRLVEIVSKTDKKVLAIWAIDCTKRVLPYFEKKYPDDPRPSQAIRTLQEWIKTGNFSMSTIREASLGAHAAARAMVEDSPARSAARSAGQAVATAHVPTHSIGAAIYALQAIYRASDKLSAMLKVNREQEWQYEHLLELIKDNDYSPSF